MPNITVNPGSPIYVTRLTQLQDIVQATRAHVRTYARLRRLGEDDKAELFRENHPLMDLLLQPGEWGERMEDRE